MIPKGLKQFKSLKSIKGIEGISYIFEKIELVIDNTKKGVSEILLNGKKIREETLKRVLIKFIEINKSVKNEIIEGIIKGVENKEKLMDIIDSNDTIKLISLFKSCEVNKLVYYINSNKRGLIIDTIQQKPRDKIEKLAKEINKTRLPAITEEKIFI